MLMDRRHATAAEVLATSHASVQIRVADSVEEWASLAAAEVDKNATNAARWATSLVTVQVVAVDSAEVRSCGAQCSTLRETC